jgi:malonate transporter and related proteins
LTVILESVVPLFAVIFLGYFAGRTGFLGESGIRGLGAFVFNFAIPPHVFRLMAETELGTGSPSGAFSAATSSRRPRCS